MREHREVSQHNKAVTQAARSLGYQVTSFALCVPTLFLPSSRGPRDEGPQVTHFYLGVPLLQKARRSRTDVLGVPGFESKLLGGALRCESWPIGYQLKGVLVGPSSSSHTCLLSLLRTSASLGYSYCKHLQTIKQSLSIKTY